MPPAPRVPLPTSPHLTLAAHLGPVHVVTYNADGNYCLTGGQDKTIRLWNPSTGVNVKTYEGHGWEVLGICVYVPESTYSSCRVPLIWWQCAGQFQIRFVRWRQECFL